MSVITRLNLGIRSTVAANAPAVAGGVLEGLVQRVLSSGTGDYQADKTAAATYTIGTSATQSVDLTTITDPNGDAIALAEVRGVWIECPATNADSVQVANGASNGFPIISGTTDHLDVHPGGLFVWYVPLDGDAPVSGTDKVIDLTNTSGASSATVTIVVLGASA